MTMTFSSSSFLLKAIKILIKAFMVFTLLLGLIYFNAVQANSSTTAQTELRKAALAQTISGVIQPAFAQFQQRADVFYQASETFSKTQYADNFVTVQNAWKELAIAWNHIRIYRFGVLVGKDLTPYAYYLDSSLLKGKDFSKKIKQSIDTFLAENKTNAIFKLEALAQTIEKQSFNQQGLLAAEILLFDADFSLESYQKQPALAVYLQAQAKVLKQRASYLNQHWQSKDYVTQLLAEADISSVKLFNAIWDSLTFAKKERLGNVYRNEQAYPQKVEAWRSQQSAANLAAWLQAIQQTLVAQQITTKETSAKNKLASFYQLLQADGYQTGDKFITHIHAIQQALAALYEPLTDSVSNNKEAVINIQQALDKFSGFYERNAMNSLGIDLGFNFNDGD
jgi:predicted lipoprotein